MIAAPAEITSYAKCGRELWIVDPFTMIFTPATALIRGPDFRATWPKPSALVL